MNFEIKNENLKRVQAEGRSLFCFESVSGEIALPEIMNVSERFFIVEMCLLEDHSGAFELVFYAKEEEKPRMIMRFGMLPRVTTMLCFDMNWLDGHVLFPGNTPGALKFVCHGSRIARDEISYVALRSYTSYHDVHVKIENLKLTDEKPVDYPFDKVKLVDAFGQSTIKEWEGKIHDEQQLCERLLTLSKESDCAGVTNGRYFGKTTQKLQEGTGFFTSVKVKGEDLDRWYLADPEGYAFFSMGPDCVGLYNDGRIDNVESLLEWLPEVGSDMYSLFVDEKLSPFDEVGRPITRSISFEKINLYRVWKEDWYEQWKELLYRQFTLHGLNSLGNWSDRQLFGTIKIPYVTQLKEFPTTEKKIFRDFPDVFSEAYVQDAKRCAQELAIYKEDPYMIGYFLRNEPMFAFVDGLIIADEVLYNPEHSVCKDVLINDLRERYLHIEALNKAYGLSLTSFEALYQPIQNISKISEAAMEDMRAFSRKMMRAYVEIPSKACREIDRNHMNLGMRWAWISDPDLVEGWENFDVFSINCYAVDPTASLDQVRQLGVDLPVLIGEFHFGALDAGPTATGLEAVVSQEERGIAYQYYCEKVATHPYGVGCHYFQLYDQFPIGRFDGENYNIGLFDVCSQPYKAMMAYVKKSSERVYDIKSGSKEPTTLLPKTMPMIAY